MSIPVNNSGNLSISDKHTINFAVLYNKQPDDELLLMDSSMNVHEITFDSHDITYSEFKNIFYQNSFGVYNINEIYKYIHILITVVLFYFKWQKYIFFWNILSSLYIINIRIIYIEKLVNELLLFIIIYYLIKLETTK